MMDDDEMNYFLHLYMKAFRELEDAQCQIFALTFVYFLHACLSNGRVSEILR